MGGRAEVRVCGKDEQGPSKGRWVDVNKGDDANPNYRSRYVAKEIKAIYGGNQREDVFAAMPPLESLKLLISKTASRDGLGGERHKMLMMDISKAYLHADVIDPILFVEVPPEIDDGQNCARLKGALYGTLEAAKCWKQSTSARCARWDSRRVCPAQVSSIIRCGIVARTSMGMTSWCGGRRAS